MKNDKKITRSEVVERVQRLIHQAYMADVDTMYYDGLWAEVEKLKEPVTLAKFFGWEEEKEYKCLSGKYKIINGGLYFYERTKKCWSPAKIYLYSSNIKAIRNAEPIEDEKYYLINPEIEDSGSKYLNAEIDYSEITGISFLDKNSSTVYQTKFSKTDLETIKNKFPKTFSICEVVEVEEES